MPFKRMYLRTRICLQYTESCFSLHQMLWYLRGKHCCRRKLLPSIGELQVLIQTLDTVRRQPWRKVLTADIDSLHEQTNRLLKKRRCSKSSFGILILISIQWESGSPIKDCEARISV